jgi:penicillin amidase
MKLFDNLFHVGKMGMEQLSRACMPKLNTRVYIKEGVTQKVKVIRDTWGIPHIYAQNLPDLLFAQGYCHAQDRLWQMELNRRAANGTLSEMLGSDLLDTDITARTLGFKRLGLSDKNALSAELITLLERYTAGINAFISQHPTWHSVEFQLLRHRPQLWTIDDTLSFSRLLSWQLSHAWQSQLLRGRIIERVGTALAAHLELEYTPQHPTILEKGIELNLRDNAFLRGLNHELMQQNGGSNSWALPPERTTTGGALLCNDPHLGLSAPAIWYENHLYCPQLHVSGVSVPAFPLVQIGHNEHIAWGITLAFTDCEDLFIEQFKDNTQNEYLYQGEWHKTQKIAESIAIKGQSEAHIAVISSTQHGVLVSDIIDYPQKSIALQSAVLQPNMPLMQAWLDINRAHNFDTFVAATEHLHAPQLNLCYADTEGNVGYCLTGKTPIRKNGKGKVPVSGYSGNFDWVGYIPFEQMPRALNPQKGYVMTANHKVVADDYPYFLGETWMNGYRAQRIEEVLANWAKVSPQDCQNLQCDQYSISGKQFAQHYQALYQHIKTDLFTPKSPKSEAATYQKALFYLATWDGNLTAESIGGCLYHLTYHCLMRQLLLPSLGESLLYSIMGNGFHPAMNPTNEYQGHLLTAILRLLNDPQNEWIQKAGGKQALLESSLQQAIAWLNNHIGKNISEWQWGKLRVAELRHALSIKSPLDRIFNIGPFPVGGDAETVWQASSLDGTFPNKKIISASYRQIIDLADFSQSKAVMPPGQSGHLGSKHYQSQMQLWLQGKLRPMLWTPEQVAAYAENTLVLCPNNSEKNKAK